MTAVVRQAMVDAVEMVRTRYPWPKDLNSYTPDSPRSAGWMDVNDYFSVLNDLSIEPGYTLDYVYHSNGSGAQPFLYARRLEDKPYATLGEVTSALDQNDKHIDPDKNIAHDYLGHVQMNDSENAYFQYVVLRIKGGQFYLWWHAAYNDREIICDRESLERLFSSSEESFSPPEDVRKKARNLDLKPKVVLGKETAKVRVVTFTSWGGFIEETYVIQRSFPHIIQDIQSNTLVGWRVNVTY